MLIGLNIHISHLMYRISNVRQFHLPGMDMCPWDRNILKYPDAGEFAAVHAAAIYHHLV